MQILLLSKVKTRWSENHAAQGFHYIFSNPIQKRAPASSLQLEAVYLEALLYHKLMDTRI